MSTIPRSKMAEERFWLRLALYVAMAICVAVSVRTDEPMAGLGAVVALAGLAITSRP